MHQLKEKNQLRNSIRPVRNYRKNMIQKDETQIRPKPRKNLILMTRQELELTKLQNHSFQKV